MLRPIAIASERFDVTAKSDGSPRYDFLKPELETMFQSVLADRFKLTAHRDSKDLPIYSLIVATSLNGSYSYVLDWTRYLQPVQSEAGAGRPEGDRPISQIPFDPASVQAAITTPLEEQLGLRLESGKGPVETIVIDHLERPFQN